jgi:hypothetical protein
MTSALALLADLAQIGAKLAPVKGGFSVDA